MNSLDTPAGSGGTTDVPPAHLADDIILAAVLDGLNDAAPAGSLWEVTVADDRTAYGIDRQDRTDDHATMLMVQASVMASVMRAAEPGSGWTLDVHDGNTGLTMYRLDLDALAGEGVA